jgi:signal peptidase I
VKRTLYLFALLICVGIAGCGDNSWSSGDRVLVAKWLYDGGLGKPERFDVVVFRYPKTPLVKGVPKNYIKRLLGLPGELLAILFGRLYRAEGPIPSFPEDANADPLRLWEPQHMHSKILDPNEGAGKKEWETRQFKIVRKPLPSLLAMRRPVYDNDHPAKDLEGILPPRWAGVEPTAWVADDKHGFRHDGSGNQVDWLRYRHILRPADWPLRNEGVIKEKDLPDGKQIRVYEPLVTPQEYERQVAAIAKREHKPQLITDYLAYNNVTVSFNVPRGYDAHNWVGDLMLECNLKVEKAQGEFCMELSKGVDRFQACWDLQSGTCTLVRLDKDGKRQELDSKTTRLKAPGDYALRFANVDARLTVWVDGDLPFGDGKEYDEPAQRGPTRNDLQPASLGSKGAAVHVHGLKLFRDTYYTLEGQGTDYTVRDADDPPEKRFVNATVDWSDPKTWEPLRQLHYRQLYVQPGHYLCLGDNSPQSSDSRDWGTVPERLMLGRALLVYFPFNRAGKIR